MKSVLVIGMGILGSHLAKRMQEMGNEVMVVDKNEDLIQGLATQFEDAIIGDCTNPEVVKSLGVNNFDYCFVAIGENFYASLEITSILKELGAKYVISKAKQTRQEKFLKQIGADEVFYPEKEIAEKLAVRYNFTNVSDYIDLDSECGIYEIPVKTEWIGKSIIEMDVRRKYNANIIATKRGGKLNPIPKGEYVFREGDSIIVICYSKDINKITE